MPAVLISLQNAGLSKKQATHGAASTVAQNSQLVLRRFAIRPRVFHSGSMQWSPRSPQHVAAVFTFPCSVDNGAHCDTTLRELNTRELVMSNDRGALEQNGTTVGAVMTGTTALYRQDTAQQQDAATAASSVEKLKKARRPTILLSYLATSPRARLKGGHHVGNMNAQDWTLLHDRSAPPETVEEQRGIRERSMQPRLGTQVAKVEQGDDRQSHRLSLQVTPEQAEAHGHPERGASGHEGAPLSPRQSHDDA